MENEDKILKNRVINIRINEDDYKFLKEKSKNYNSMSEFIRCSLEDQKSLSKNKNIKKLLSDNEYFLKKIGNNINQIARNNNSKFYSEIDKKNLLENLENIQNEFKNIKEKISNN